jgi:hypothetical protein
MLRTVERPDRYEPPQIGEPIKFDWTSRLSIEAIRDHTKTDDIPGVTDQQLKPNRAAAIEAAEKCTGLLLSGQRTITEPIEGPAHPKRGKLTYRHRVYQVGLLQGQGPQPVKPQKPKIKMGRPWDGGGWL